MNWCRPVDEGRQREMVDYFQHKLKGEYLKKIHAPHFVASPESES